MQVLKLGIVGLFVIFLFGCTNNRPNNTLGLVSRTQELQPVGWSILRLDEPGVVSTLVPSLTLDGVLPGDGSQIRIGALPGNPVFPTSGTVYRHLAPVWSDPDGSRLVTRLSKGESITILRKEIWRINRGNVAHLYFVEDSLGNRGYAGSDSIVIPRISLGTLTVSILETFDLEYVSEPPWNQHRVFGRQRLLPVIQEGSNFFVLVPSDPEEVESFNLGGGDISSLVLGTVSEIDSPPLFFMAGSQALTEDLSLFSISGFYLDDSEPRAFLQEAYTLPYFVDAITTPRLVPSLSQFFDPDSLSGVDDRGVVVEFAGTSLRSVVGSIRGWSLKQEETSALAWTVDYPSRGQVRNTEESAALRQGPGQAYSVLSRLPFGATVIPLEIHVPSVEIQNSRGFWVRVSYNNEQGWIWGDFLRTLRQ